MNKKTLAVLSLICLLSLGLTYKTLFSSKKQNTTPIANPTNFQDLSNQAVQGGPRDNPEEAYKTYSHDAFVKDPAKKRVIFFTSPSCTSCKPIEKELTDSKASIPTDYTIFVADLTQEKDLAAKLGVNYQHTFVVVDQNGQKTLSWNGGGLRELLINLR